MKITCRINPLLKVRCIILRWISFRYCHTFVFLLIIFGLLWHDVCLQLQCIYPYLLMILEWNPKLLASYGTLLLNLKSNWSIANCQHTLHFVFVITRHSCHRCVYLMVVDIFTVFACTITFSLKSTCLCRFSLSFGGFGNFTIMWSSDPHLKHFRGDDTPTAQYFSFPFLILLKHFPQNDCYLQKMCTLPEHNVLSNFVY